MHSIRRFELCPSNESVCNFWRSTGFDWILAEQKSPWPVQVSACRGNVLQEAARFVPLAK